MCTEAIEKGVKGIAITDHMNTRVFDKENTLKNIQEMIPDVEHAKEKYKDKLQVFCGIEISEMLDDYTRYLERIISKNIALEVNTAGYHDEDGWHSLPDAEILKLYYEKRKLVKVHI